MAIKLNLPVDQNWSCHSCGGCCKQHQIVMTDEERRRIVGQKWQESEGIPADFATPEKVPGRRRMFRMRQRDDGSCVFLDERGLCRIHGKFGEDAKPLACRVYPYVFHPAGGRMTVSLRFSCPSVVRNAGRPVRENAREIRRIAAAVVPEQATDLPPANLTTGQPLDWKRFRTIVESIEEEIENETVPLGQRLSQTLTWLAVLPQTAAVRMPDDDLRELLDVIRRMATVEVQRDQSTWLPPGRTAMSQFRLLAGQYARIETQATKAAGLPMRLRLLKAGLGLARGKGQTTAIRDEFGSVDFAQLAEPTERILPDVDGILTRMLLVKIAGLHFCGRGYYGRSLIDGFAALAALIPAIHYLARWTALTRGEAVAADHYLTAITSADHHHGFSPAFGQRSYLRRTRFLLESGELRRLVRHYAVGRSPADGVEADSSLKSV